MPSTPQRYGQIGVRDALNLLVMLSCFVPFALYQYARRSSLRHLCVSLARFSTRIPYPQTQFLLGSSLAVMRTWSWIQNVGFTVTDLHDHFMNGKSNARTQKAHIVFLGSPPLQDQKVIYYIPGGGYVNPLMPFSITFFFWIQSQLSGVRVAILLYRLRPCAPFPAPIIDVILGLRCLVDKHQVKPENLQIAGDSAGGHLVLQLLAILGGKVSIPNAPECPKLHANLAGVLLISPWVCLAGHSGWDDRFDTLSKEMYQQWGLGYLADFNTFLQAFPADTSYEAFSDSHLATSVYFSFVSTVTSRVLITSGELECMSLSGGHQRLYELIHDGTRRVQAVSVDKDAGDKDGFCDVRLLVQRQGVHGDPMIDFLFWFRGLGEMRLKEGIQMQVVDWLKRGMTDSIRSAPED